MKKKEFDNIFDECLERILAGETLEQCLVRYPEQADELKPLLETVLAVKAASSVEPRSEFKARARYGFRSALQEKAAPQRRSFWGWVPRWATALAIFLVVLLAGGGTVAAASNSMPDSILYPVKLATEQVQMALTTSDLGKAQLCSDFADRRVTEIVYMAEKGDAEQVEVLTDRLDERLDTLVVLASELKVGGAGDVTNEAAPMLSIPDTDSGEEAPSPPPPSVLDEGGRGQPQNWAEITVRVAVSADNNTAVMLAVLDEVPEEAREALLEALAVLEDGYEEVFRALS